jgi:FkbM family methyltransferase
VPTTDVAADYQNDTRNDRWIVEQIFPGRRDGFFVEAGAADGVNGSSCYVLERHLGWTGICVEPHTGFFADLVTNRPGSTCVNVCLSDAAGPVDFVDGDNAFLSGIRTNLQRFKHEGESIAEAGTPRQQDALTLEEVLDADGAPARIDYAAFDIEGSELEVLRGFDFDRYRFSALTLECDGRIWDDITDLLQANGYREVSNPFNTDKPWERYWLDRQLDRIPFRGAIARAKRTRVGRLAARIGRGTPRRVRSLLSTSTEGRA